LESFEPKLRDFLSTGGATFAKRRDYLGISCGYYCLLINCFQGVWVI